MQVTMSNKRCTLSAKTLREVYDGDQFKAVIVCGYCSKIESPEEEFAVCSRCNFKPYCSRECQKLHWRIHKHEDCKEKNEDSTLAVNKAARKVNKFSTMFGPLVNRACFNTLLVLKIDYPEASSETHAVMVYLSDVTAKHATKPRLQIDMIVPIVIADLPSEYRMQKLPKEVEKLGKYYHHTVYVYENSLGRGFIAPNCQWYDLKASERPGEEDRKLIVSDVNTIVDTINAIAKGERPDLYEIVRGKACTRASFQNTIIT